MELVGRDDPAPLDGRGDAVDALGELRALAVHRPGGVDDRCLRPVRIAFVHFPGRLARLEAARAGEGPTEFLFGAIELERAGARGHAPRGRPRRAGGPARPPADRPPGRSRRLPPHASAAVLAGTQAPPARAPARRTSSSRRRRGRRSRSRRGGCARRLETPLVGIVAGLLNDPWGRARRTTTLPLLRAMHAMLYGPGRGARACEALDPGLAGRVHVNRFGVDTRVLVAAAERRPAACSRSATTGTATGRRSSRRPPRSTPRSRS